MKPVNATRIHEAFQAGDLEAVRSAACNPATFPNCEVAWMSSYCLEYAIYHSPLPFIQQLLDLGADPNYPDAAGFPSLIAALSTDRSDRHRIVDTLISAGANLQQRGVNDYTPLHYAAMLNDPIGIDLLVRRGADLQAKTRVDDFATPLEEARILGRAAAVAALERALEPGWNPPEQRE